MLSRHGWACSITLCVGVECVEADADANVHADANTPDQSFATIRHHHTGLFAQWTVELLAKSVNLKHSAIHTALRELVDLGWLWKSPVKNAGGQVSGFVIIWYRPRLN